MISQNIIEEIKQRADIVDVISTYINVIKKGNSFVAVCPFHNDTNPSLQISRSKQLYKCFSCGAGGNVFTFVQEYEKLSFIEAVRKVASIIGYDNKELLEPIRTISDETKDVLNALKGASDLYSYILKTQEGENASNYLKNRNIDEEMSDYFSLGYCPNDGEASIKMLRGKNISIEALDKAGIIIRQNDQFLDRFKGRLMFPLFNEYGDVVGFSARRIVDNDEAKYVNSTNTLVFNKSKILYNYQNASREAKKAGYVYVTEGFMDVFSLYKVGIKSAVAIMGTAFTEYHAKLLKKLNVEVRICLDGDDAGQHGILAMLPILEKERISFKIVNYKDCKLDPDEILQQYGDKILAKFLNRLINKDDFIFQYYLKRNDVTTSEGKREFSKIIIDYVSKSTNVIDQEFTLRKLSEVTGLSIDSYKMMIRDSKNDINEKPQIVTTNFVKHTQEKAINNYTRVENEIIRLMLAYVDAINKFSKGNNYFNDKIYDDLANYIMDFYALKQNIDVSDFITYLQANETDNTKSLVQKVMETQNLLTKSLEYTDELMDDYLKQLNKNNEKIKFKKELSDAFSGMSPQEQALVLERYASKRRK